MCLIEANQAVYPLDIVRQMRDQRAMLIQTAVCIIVNTMSINLRSVDNKSICSHFYIDIMFSIHI